MTIPRGQDVTMTCETSKPEQPVVWCKDGAEIEATDSGKYQIVGDGRRHSLVIKDAEICDSGKYTAHTGDEETKATICVEGSLFYTHYIPDPPMILTVRHSSLINLMINTVSR